MNNTNTIAVRIICIALVALCSCQPDPIQSVQGVYSANKKSLRTSLEGVIETKNVLSSALLNAVIENAEIQFQINGDSINGIMFLAGQSNVIQSRIELRNDSMVVKLDDGEAYLIPGDSGLIYQNKRAGIAIQMSKTNATALSPEISNALAIALVKKKEQAIFEAKMGEWLIGNLVDEFGDNTRESYLYSIIRGTHESSITKSEVYVKSFIQGEGVYFEIYNGSMTMKETFPDKEFGYIKLKFPNGEVKTERVFFFQNSISEAPTGGPPIIHEYLKNGGSDLKVLVDLSTASRYYSDKYQFTIGANNLLEVLTKIQ